MMPGLTPSAGATMMEDRLREIRTRGLMGGPSSRSQPGPVPTLFDPQESFPGYCETSCGVDKLPTRCGIEISVT